MNTNWIDKSLQDAVQLIYADQVQEGLAVMQSLLYEEPGHGNLHNHLGWAYWYYTPNRDQAELHLNMAIRFAPENTAPYLHLADLYMKTDRSEQALDVVERALSVARTHRVALFELKALAFESRKQYREAIAAYKAALSISSGEEGDPLIASIRRCRKKRWVLLFN
ncbi:MAG: hypothetical protein K1X47_06065 [Cyclobacteriaceae bacterium]|nr:hypothetical protein [Cyclobacteriaceae bacterium]